MDIYSLYLKHSKILLRVVGLLPNQNLTLGFLFCFMNLTLIIPIVSSIK